MSRDIDVEVDMWQYDVSVYSYFVIQNYDYTLSVAKEGTAPCAVYVCPKHWCLPTQNITF
jgi:hypothetical protein